MCLVIVQVIFVENRDFFTPLSAFHSAARSMESNAALCRYKRRSTSEVGRIPDVSRTEDGELGWHL